MADTKEKTITRLPPYFPTSCKQCAQQTEKFFMCFEKHAVMRSETDVLSAKSSLSHCQSELREYMNCMDQHIANKEKKSWWRVW